MGCCNNRQKTLEEILEHDISYIFIKKSKIRLIKSSDFYSEVCKYKSYNCINPTSLKKIKQILNLNSPEFETICEMCKIDDRNVDSDLIVCFGLIYGKDEFDIKLKVLFNNYSDFTTGLLSSKQMKKIIKDLIKIHISIVPKSALKYFESLEYKKYY